MLVISTLLVLCVILEKVFLVVFFFFRSRNVSSSLKLGVDSRYPRF